MSFQFIHAADIHLDSPLKGLERYEGAPVDEIRIATRQALENLVQLAIDEEVSFVLIAGDVYDGDWKDFQTGLYFAKQMNLLRKAGIPVVAVHGNHDAMNRMTRSLHLPENVHVLSAKSPQTVTGNDLGLSHLDVAIHGLSFASAAVAENVVPGFPVREPHCFNIGMLHTSLDYESQGGHARYAPCRLGDLTSKGYEYWALGHIHQRAIRSEEPFVAYSGNTQGRHIREPHAKGCFLVHVDDNHKVQAKFRPLDVLRWEHCQVPAAGANHPEDLLARFTERLQALQREHGGMPLAVRVTVEGSCPAHQELAASPERWTNEFRSASMEASGGTAWVEKVHLRTSPPRRADETLLEGPLHEVRLALQELRAGAASLGDLPELADLRRKLPEELNQEPDWRRFDDPARMAEYLDEVEALLMGRLVSAEEGT